MEFFLDFRFLRFDTVAFFAIVVIAAAASTDDDDDAVNIAALGLNGISSSLLFLD